MNDLLQLWIMLHGQQRVVETWVGLKLFLGPTGHHPDRTPMLIGYAFTHIPFNFEVPQQLQITSYSHIVNV